MNAELLNQFRNHLLQDKNPASTVTVKNYLADVRKFMFWFESRIGCPFSPKLFTSQVAQQYKIEIKTQGEANPSIPASSSAKRYLSSLKKFAEFLIKKKLITNNPFSFEAREKKQSQETWYLQEFKEYLSVSKASPLTTKNYLVDIRQFLSWTKNVLTDSNQIPKTNTLLTKIDSLLVEEYKQRLLAEARISPTSVNRKLSSLRKYFTFLSQEGLLASPINFAQVINQPNLAKENRNSNQEAKVITSINPMDTTNSTSQDQGRSEYAAFAPVRLGQKITRAITLSFDILIVLSFVKLVGFLRYHLWSIRGKEVFIPVTNQIDTFITQQPQEKLSGIHNLPKSFYAPLSISTKNLALHKKILHHMRHKRPKWYKRYHSYPIVHYIHFGVVLVYATVLGATIYQAFTQAQHLQQPAFASLPTSPPRLLAFQGRLADASNTPLTAENPLRFTIYDSATATDAALLWQENQVVQPDHDGNFSVLLGSKEPLRQSLLTENPQLFLGITIGRGNELVPRQQLATVANAKSAEDLQGLLPITQGDAGTKNVILALDSSGNLTIGGSASPTFAATGGEFRLSGKTLTLTTAEGSNTNIQLAPDGTGIIDLQKPIQNTTNYSSIPGMEGAVAIDDSVAILASASGQSALVINQNGTGDLLSASVSGIAKFGLDNEGSGFFAGNLSVNGNNLTTKSPTFNLVNTNAINLNIGGSATAISLGATSGTTTINHSLTVKGITSLGAATNITGLLTANNGITVKLANASTNTVGIDNHFMTFATAGMGEVGSIRGNGSNGIQLQQSGVADWAEYFKKETNELIPFGSLVCLRTDGNTVACNESQQNVVGVASEHPTVIAGENHGDGSIAVGLTGLVKTMVSAANGKITPGDMITLSSLPGVGVKATQSGMVVGRAIEGYDTTDSLATGSILVSVHISWYDPLLKLTNTGNLQDPTDQEKNTTGLYVGIINDIKTKIAVGGNVFSEQIDALLKEKLQDLAKELFTQKIISPLAEINTLHTNMISPLGEDAHILVELDKDKLTIHNDASTAAVATIDNQGNASFSGTIRAKKIIAEEIDLSAEALAKVEGLNSRTATLSANYITNITNVYNSIATPSAQTSYATLSAELAYVPTFSADFAKFNQGLIALGPSSLTDVSVNGQLRLGNNMVITDSSINTLGTDLAIQPLRQGNLSFMGGLMTIATDGNVAVNGNATFAKDITVKGKLMASIIAPVPGADIIFNDAQGKEALAITHMGDLIGSGAAQFSQIATQAFKIIRGAQADTSMTQTTASASAGTATITAHEKSRTIVSPYVREDSLIYITATSDTQGLTPYVARQTQNSFTIEIPQTATKNIKLNWWIVN